MKPTCLVVFEDAGYRSLLPLVYPRATFNLRCGFDNLLSKIERAFGRQADALFVRPALAAVMDERQRTQYDIPRSVNRSPASAEQLWVNGRMLVRSAFDLPVGSAMWQGDTLVAAHFDKATADKVSPANCLDSGRLREALAALKPATIPSALFTLFDYPWQVVAANAAEIGRQAGAMEHQNHGLIYPGAHLLRDSEIHIGVGTKVKSAAVLDAESGPIIIGNKVVISPNVTITGPVYIGDNCIIQPGASIRGGTSIGPTCKVGGEVEGTIIHAYSNKQHDGFLGHSYVGEWVNLGADTLNSDLKNTYGSVRVSLNGEEIDTGETFVGAFIGDHAKTGIGTRLPTGCVVGYATNIFISQYAPKFTPSFTWLTDEGPQQQNVDKAVSVARTVMSRRNRQLTPAEEALFRAVAAESVAVECRV